MSAYRRLRETADYEVGRLGADLVAACLCGDGMTVPDKGLGRASVAAWETRHQHTTRPGDVRGTDHTKETGDE